MLGLVEPIFERFGFDPLATFTLINERAMVAVLNLAFDKAEEDEAARAASCYDEVMQAIISQGFTPYRVGPRGMPKVREEGDAFWDVTTSLKRALDPHDIIARGRYIPPLGD